MRTPLFLPVLLALLLMPVTAQAGWRYSAPPGVSSPAQSVVTEVRMQTAPGASFPVREAVFSADPPRRGSTQGRVLREIGDPELRVLPVGRPPIARWLYPAFIVYFERDRVITSVPR